MTKAIIVLIQIIVLPFFSSAQIFDGRVTIKVDSTWSGKVSTFYHKEVDTLSAIFLCSDTASFDNANTILHKDGNFSTIDKTSGRFPLCYWQYGYVVIDEWSFYKRTQYLDVGKKRMYGLVIWQYIIINDTRPKPF